MGSQLSRQSAYEPGHVFNIFHCFLGHFGGPVVEKVSPAVSRKISTAWQREIILLSTSSWTGILYLAHCDLTRGQAVGRGFVGFVFLALLPCLALGARLSFSSGLFFLLFLPFLLLGLAFLAPRACFLALGACVFLLCFPFLLSGLAFLAPQACFQALFLFLVLKACFYCPWGSCRKIFKACKLRYVPKFHTFFNFATSEM